jgi:hypothetical protein
MTVHKLKTWPEFFDAILSGEKTFEIRYDDRGYRAGDRLLLQEWRPQTKEYTGREMWLEVTYIIQGFEGLAPGWVAMSIVSAFLPRNWRELV